MGFVIRWHESAMELHVFPIPIPPPTSLSTRFLWVFPVHQAQALVSCIPSGRVIWVKSSLLVLNIVMSSKNTYIYVISATSNPPLTHGSIFRNPFMVIISLFGMTLIVKVRRQQRLITWEPSFTDFNKWLNNHPKDSMTWSSYMCQLKPLFSPILPNLATNTVTSQSVICTEMT